MGKIIRLCLCFFGGLILRGAAFSLSAQSDLLLSQYSHAMGYYNPAQSGRSGEVKLTALHNRQWEGMPGASKSFVLMADAPIPIWGQQHGAGIVLTNETIGLFTQTELAGQFAFRQRLKSGFLSIGVEGCFYNSSFDGTKVKLPEGEGSGGNDPAIPLTKVGGKTFDLRAGLMYIHPKWYVGVAARHILNPQLKYDLNHYIRLVPSYNLLAGYNIKPVGSLLAWYPSVFALTDGYSYRVDVNMGMSYADKFYASLMYRPMAAAGLSFGMRLGSVFATYAFEMPTSSLAHRNWGSHELLLTYSFPLSQTKKGDVRYKSVRLL
ncbi:PorP/SprF family type IX secretion system membrane protein [Porphyromonas crevioricanis]|uniref:PorP/SprF family type IX secretion system membrane protein n=1 Tax=Porphyromonas crevioricanis TaxID=393921 RepID=UPI000AD41CF2|nr:type IX secretion system membrane protein PorP/SprF [Porphyromonas crevioricanis]